MAWTAKRKKAMAKACRAMSPAKRNKVKGLCASAMRKRKKSKK